MTLYVGTYIVLGTQQLLNNNYSNCVTSCDNSSQLQVKCFQYNMIYSIFILRKEIIFCDIQVLCFNEIQFHYNTSQNFLKLKLYVIYKFITETHFTSKSTLFFNKNVQKLFHNNSLQNQAIFNKLFSLKIILHNYFTISHQLLMTNLYKKKYNIRFLHM